jgi:hypothetical protein
VGQTSTRDLTEREAGHLVIAALDASARKLPKLALDAYADIKVPAPGFYKFAVTWDNKEGSVIVGFFAVNRKSGDVWRLVTCNKVTTPDLSRLQKAMRKRIGLRQMDFLPLTDNAPCEP